MKGLIEKLWEREDRKGAKYLVVQIGGERYSLWDEEQMDGLQPGIRVEYEWRQAGRYKNLTKVRTRERYQEPRQVDGRERDMVRMSCLKSAASLLAESDLDPEDKGDRTLDLARLFERYVTGNDDG